MIIRAKVNPNFTFQKILKRTKGSSEAVNEKLYPAHKRNFTLHIRETLPWT
jgi:hypothetical protein